MKLQPDPWEFYSSHLISLRFFLVQANLLAQFGNIFFTILLVFFDFHLVNGELINSKMINEIVKTFSPPICSRPEPQGIERGRTLTRISSVAKYGGAGANFRGRKSNSLMNLCGGKQHCQIVISEDKIDWNEDESDIGLT